MMTKNLSNNINNESQGYFINEVEIDLQLKPFMQNATIKGQLSRLNMDISLEDILLLIGPLNLTRKN